MMPLRGLLVASCCVFVTVMGDAPSSGYSAPATGGNSYAAPAASGSSYAAPASTGSNYGAPAASYSSPQASYNEPTGYAAPSTGYEAQSYDYNEYAPSYENEDSGLDFSKLYILIPVFLAVLAAIIIAALIGPFIAQLGVIAVGILPMALNVKAPIINAILAPFSLTLCTPGNPPTVFPAAGRQFADMASEYGISEDQVATITDFAYTLVDTVKDQFMS